MTSPLRRRLRLARRGLWYFVAITLVVMALISGVASQLLPLAERHPDRIAGWLSDRAGRQVAFDAVDTEWTRRGPLLRLEGLRIGTGRQTLVIGDAEMLVSQYAGLLPGRSFTELRLRGLDLTLERADDGRWSVRGLPGQDKPGGDPFGALEGLGELQVIGGKLHVIAPSLGIDAQLPKIDLRLQVHGNRVLAGLRAWMRPSVAPLRAVLDFDRKRGDGRAYAGAKEADLAVWAPLLRIAGVQVEAGRGRAEAWGELHGHRIASVTVDAALTGVRLRGAQLRDASGVASTPNSGFDRVEARARWQTVVGGWRFDAPTLRIGNGQHEQRLDGVVLAGGRRYALLAERVDVGPLLEVVALSDHMTPGLRQWLLSAKPQAVLERVEVAGVRDGALHARARIAGLGFLPVGKSPGVQGLGGELDGDTNGFALRFDPAATVRFDWPRGFGVVHTMKLRGEVGGWREGQGWRVGTAALRIDGDGFGANARGGLWWQGDGTRPWIDIATELDTTKLPVAKGFWLREDMPPPAIRWLDAALVGGELQNGRAIVSGDLDDWPFRDRNGLFRADAHIANATLKFQPDWPAVEGVEADTSFIADGFTVDGKARLGGTGIQQLHAGIDHYHDGKLVVQAQGAGDAASLLATLKQSPLQKDHAETFANLTASGPADVDFDLVLPMGKGGKLSLGGTVELKNTQLADARWKLKFDQVNGKATYSRSGFKADDLSVRHDGEPGKLSLRAGDEYVRERGNVFEAGLEASLIADELIDRAPDLAWLKPYLEGRSAWTVGIAIPKSAKNQDAPTQLQLRSNLLGTSLTLPAPLRKAADVALSAAVNTPLPLGSGEIQVALGNLMALRARSANQQTGVRIVLGSDKVDEAPPASGLIATGRAGTLDAIDWIAIAKGGDKGEGLPLRRIDVTADRLLLLGGSFSNTRLQVVPANDGASAVTVTGQALAGAMLVPQAENAAIAGRFDRLYWRSAGNTATVATTDSGPDFDPAKIPPLTFEIGDLRFNDAQLGNASVRTRPVAAGMRLEQLQARAPKQRINLSGDWLGRGSAARTQLDLAIDSDDFGALLTGFGFGGQLGGGDGSAKFTATWPGTPAAFKLQTLDGNLTLDAQNGRLIELEPGAGRVLGLLSIAQLPRRMMFDFRDLFSKGFAFNRINGHVRVAQGSARSDDLKIDGPAAQIRIRGAADLRAQTFDQTVEVLPKAGNLLTVAGAIAGGPVGAAIGAAANAMLNKPLGQMAAKTYRVTGPWKDPKVEVIKREQSRVSATQGEPSG